MDVLILGGSGHVSGAVASAALARGASVWTLTRGRRALPPGVRPLVADRHDAGATAAAVAGVGHGWDLVVDCICYDLPDLRQDLELFRHRARQFVLVSTDFVYDPRRRRFPQPEAAEFYATSVPGPLDYGRRKRLCEEALGQSETGPMAWTVVRPCHIYGASSELGCLPLHGRDTELIGTLRAGQPLHLVGGGHFLQQPILASDLAETIFSIAGNPRADGRTFNTAGPDLVESREYYRLVAEVLGVELIVEEVPVATYRAANPDKEPFLCHRVYDLTPLREAGLKVPATPLRDGLRQHVEGLLARRRAS